MYGPMTSSCPGCLAGDWVHHENARTVLRQETALARSVCFEALSQDDPLNPLALAALRSYLNWSSARGDWSETGEPTRATAADCPDNADLVQAHDDALRVVMQFEFWEGAETSEERGDAYGRICHVLGAWSDLQCPRP